MTTLVVAAAIHAELSIGAERVRRRIAETRYVDLSSVWTFAAALLLPPLLAGAAVVITYTHLYFRVFRPSKTPPHRQIFSTSTVVLAIYAVAGTRTLFDVDAGLLTTYRGMSALVLGLLAYTTVNTLLVVSAIRLSQPGSSFLRILAGGEIMLEVGTLCLGGLAAVVLGSASAFVLLLMFPPLLLLEQSTLVRQLEARATTDAKTGLLNPDAWRWQTTTLLRQARRDGRIAAVLILDLDHFKQVNDRHGHLVGDEVLHAVAQVLIHEVRENDRAGRFGGEEFVISLGGLSESAVRGGKVRDVAERIRARVEQLRLEVATPEGPLTIADISISVGAAVYPSAGTELTELLEVSDAALYAAKRGGRNQVQVRYGGPPLTPSPQPPTPPFGLRSTGRSRP
ncbi:MAG: GGDEF domain-containing protein [Pseudonocardia sp.]|nr:GGDEF domain-containing protein [Pseudonocardia sp.]